MRAGAMGFSLRGGLRLLRELVATSHAHDNQKAQQRKGLARRTATHNIGPQFDFCTHPIDELPESILAYSR